MDQRQVEVWVSGTVQGVWFRAFTQTAAMALGVAGYVENLADGRVHLVATGPEDRVDTLLAELRTGPPGAEVGEVTVEKYAGGETFSGFTTRY